MKKLLSFFLCAILFVNINSVSVKAEEKYCSVRRDIINSSIQPRYTYIDGIDTDCNISSGKVTFYASMTCLPSATSCKVFLKLYCRPAGSSDSWEQVETYTGTGVRTATARGNVTYVSGYEYKVYASFTAYGSNGTGESTAKYSDVAP